MSDRISSSSSMNAKQAHEAGQPKVLLCHMGHEIEVAAPAVDAHLAHGDTLGPCSAPLGDCVAFNHVCSILSPVRCCGDMGCTVSIVPGLTTCQFQCQSDLGCDFAFPALDLSCVASPGVCPFLTKCCRPKDCTIDADCPRTGRCCDGRCCLPI